MPDNDNNPKFQIGNNIKHKEDKEHVYLKIIYVDTAGEMYKLRTLYPVPVDDDNELKYNPDTSSKYIEHERQRYIVGYSNIDYIDNNFVLLASSTGGKRKTKQRRKRIRKSKKSRKSRK